MQAHVYLITCAPTGETYVGGSVMVERRRWSNHRSYLRAGRHKSPRMQAAYDQYGEAAFSPSTLLICRAEDLLMFEQRAMDALRPVFNAAPKAGPVTGLKRRPEQVAARRAAFAQNPLDPIAVKNASAVANAARYEVRGELLTLREISGRYGVPLNAVRCRAYKGRRGEELIA